MKQIYKESYQKRIDNNLFRNNQRHFYRTLEKEQYYSKQADTYPGCETAKKFWNSIWETPKNHTKNPNWIKEENLRTKTKYLL